MSNYTFKNISISNIILSGNTTVSNNYIGFPKSILPQYPIIETPLPFSYTDANLTNANNSFNNVNSTKDLSNRTTLISIQYSGTTNINFNSIPTGVKYISGYCVGGSGGGGGAGGGGWTGFNGKNGGDGGGGGPGNYASIVQYEVPSSPYNIDITVGSGGNGGQGGGRAKHNTGTGNSGKSGNSGNAGTPSIISISGSPIISGSGGGAGPYGASGNSGSDGGDSQPATSPPGTSYGAGGNYTIVNYKSPYPPYTVNGGAGGNGSKEAGNDGAAGTSGIVTLYFLYS
jgi:hypothetical protein